MSLTLPVGREVRRGVAEEAWLDLTLELILLASLRSRLSLLYTPTVTMTNSASAQKPTTVFNITARSHKAVKRKLFVTPEEVEKNKENQAKRVPTPEAEPEVPVVEESRVQQLERASGEEERPIEVPEEEVVIAPQTSADEEDVVVDVEGVEEEEVNQAPQPVLAAEDVEQARIWAQTLFGAVLPKENDPQSYVTFFNAVNFVLLHTKVMKASLYGIPLTAFLRSKLSFLHPPTATMTNSASAQKPSTISDATRSENTIKRKLFLTSDDIEMNKENQAKRVPTTDDQPKGPVEKKTEEIREKQPGVSVRREESSTKLLKEVVYASQTLDEEDVLIDVEGIEEEEEVFKVPRAPLVRKDVKEEKLFKAPQPVLAAEDVARARIWAQTLFGAVLPKENDPQSYVTFFNAVNFVLLHTKVMKASLYGIPL
ncbi:unnamed protein product [Caenorhabditis auriculariae]|uniref:Uncharacterized protein n=1 Tax=Caenorhabditis auriculariae TaxID=2777116 RepID=A0A8S1HH68_9PELO|nr:unnamed protein product [Caenorhabditis auriculariae]